MVSCIRGSDGPSFRILEWAKTSKNSVAPALSWKDADPSVAHTFVRACQATIVRVAVARVSSPL